MSCSLCGGRAQGYSERRGDVPAHVCRLCAECCVWADYWLSVKRRGGAIPREVLWPKMPRRATTTRDS